MGARHDVLVALATTLIWMTFVHAETVGGCTCSGLCTSGYTGVWCEVWSFNPACNVKVSWDWCSPEWFPMTDAYCFSFVVTFIAVWSCAKLLEAFFRPGSFAVLVGYTGIRCLSSMINIYTVLLFFLGNIFLGDRILLGCMIIGFSFLQFYYPSLQWFFSQNVTVGQMAICFLFVSWCIRSG